MELGYQLFLDRILAFFLALFSAALAGGFTFGLVYLAIIYSRMKKREKVSLEMVTVQVTLQKDNEIKIDAAEQMFGSLSSLKKSGFWSALDLDDTLTFEIVGKKADIRFYVSAPSRIIDLVEKTIYGYYSNAEIQKVDEPNIFSESGKVAYASLVQKSSSYLPLKTYRDIPTDSLSAITSAISKMDDGEGAIVQVLIRPTKDKWKKEGKSYISSTKKKEADPEKATFKTDQKTLEKIDEKVSRPGFETAIRIVVSSSDKQHAEAHLRNIKTAFSQFNSDLNSLKTAKVRFKGGFMLNFIYKFFPVVNLPYARTISFFSSDELASFFHFPNKTVETPHIHWLKAKTSPVPADVPINA